MELISWQPKKWLYYFGLFSNILDKQLIETFLASLAVAIFD